jgi:hypothetical protein
MADPCAWRFVRVFGARPRQDGLASHGDRSSPAGSRLLAHRDHASFRWTRRPQLRSRARAMDSRSNQRPGHRTKSFAAARLAKPGARLGPERSRAWAMTESPRPRRWAVPHNDDRLMNVEGLMEYLDLPRDTIYRQRLEGTGLRGAGSGSIFSGSDPRSTPGWRSTRTFGSESWGFPGGRLRNPQQKTGLTRHFELARGLEPLTCCLQDSCATDCATPARRLSA